jgi:phasin family protein
MARKAAPKSAAAPKPAAKRAKPRAKSATAAGPAAGMFKMPDPADLARYAKTLTPEQAFDLYRANAKLALDVIENAIESTARLRKLQFEGEEQARSMQKKAARRAAEATDVRELVAAGQTTTREAVEQSMAYWGEMFDLIVEMQKRLFTLMESQMADVPGVRQARAAMAMLPDVSQMQNVVSAMRNVVSSGGSAFEQMQKVMDDFTKMSGLRR